MAKFFIRLPATDIAGVFLIPTISYSWNADAYTLWFCWLFWSIGVGMRKGRLCKQL